jgi:hypothetical protein
MQLSEFLKNIKKYYGNYEPIVEQVLSEYLAINFQDSEYELLFKLITNKFSNIYKSPPDKSKIIEIAKEYNDKTVGAINFKQLGRKYVQDKTTARAISHDIKKQINEDMESL